MAIVFPINPNVNDTFTVGSITYKWDSSKWIGLGVTPIDKLIDGSNQLTWSGGSVGIGVTNPTSKLHVEGLSSLSTTLDVGGISLSDTTINTYPTTSSFNVIPGISINLELGTSQTINSSTPGGYNFVTADKRVYTKMAGTTSDIERLYFSGFNQLFNWEDANTCKQYVGFNDAFYYGGINANGRTTSYLGTGKRITLAPPDGGTQSIANVNSPAVWMRPSGTSTINITNSFGYSPTIRLIATDAGTKTVNITNASFYDTEQYWGSSVSNGTVNATITNLYGLRLRSPNSTTGLTVTNKYGVYQEWSDANNYFAGNIQMGQGKGIDFSATTDPASGMTSELFDNYEEGTWLPVIENTSVAPSYSNQVGRYTRIGRVVYAQGFVQTSSGATYSNGNERLFISGLPYARSTTNSVGYVAAQGNVQAQAFNFDGANNDYSITGQVGVGFAQSITGAESGVMFYVTASGGIRGTVKNSANAGNSIILEFNLMYIAD